MAKDKIDWLLDLAISYAGGHLQDPRISERTVRFYAPRFSMVASCFIMYFIPLHSLMPVRPAMAFVVTIRSHLPAVSQHELIAVINAILRACHTAAA